LRGMVPAPKSSTKSYLREGADLFAANWGSSADNIVLTSNEQIRPHVLKSEADGGSEDGVSGFRSAQCTKEGPVWRGSADGCHCVPRWWSLDRSRIAQTKESIDESRRSPPSRAWVSLRSCRERRHRPRIVYGVTLKQTLVSWESSARPERIASGVAIWGMAVQRDESRVIDYRPATGELYGTGLVQPPLQGRSR
jgi:hypothetical protein